jgi:RimJ/RimL family protein N-acetyltransferase
MNADPEVREHLGPPLTAERAAAMARSFQDGLDRNGFGFWAAEVRGSGEFIGFTGLDPVDDGMPFTGVEAGWRLARSAWGHGYATEAAMAALEYGFATVGLPEILAVTTTMNLRSQAVMRRIGMTYDPAEDFDDPGAEEGPLRRQVLYRKLRDAVRPEAG